MKKENQQQQQANEVERRFVQSDFELRASGEDQKQTLKGYALRFGSIYDMGWFTEEVDSRALSGANMEDVRILFNHDSSLILGRTAAKTARVGVDSVGMWYEVELPNSPNGENVREAVSRGDVSQSSWGFKIRTDSTGRRIGDKWEMRNGKEHRVLTDISEVFDASPVTFPANPDTSVAKRSRDAFSAQKEESSQPDMSGTYERLTRALERKAETQTQK